MNVVHSRHPNRTLRLSMVILSVIIPSLVIASLAMGCSSADESAAPADVLVDTGQVVDIDAPDSGPAPDEGADVPGSEPGDCQTYCETLQTACTGEDQQFADTATCLTWCQDVAQLTAGVPGEAANTVSCRLERALIAAEGVEFPCEAAGPSGGGVCGSWCDNYCHIMMLHCAGDDPTYGSDAICASKCAGFSVEGEPNTTVGDSVQCRIHEATQAALNPDDAQKHCLAADPLGGNSCVGAAGPVTCEVYCERVQSACGDAGAPTSQYPDYDTCVTYCGSLAGLNGGESGDRDVNTIACRAYFTKLASGNPEAAKLHCPHAGPAGGDVCGGYCENFCGLMQRNCGAIVEFGDAGCLDTCATWSDTSAGWGASEDTVQCRLHHAALGLGNNEAECHKAGPDSGVCMDPQRR